MRLGGEVSDAKQMTGYACRVWNNFGADLGQRGLSASGGKLDKRGLYWTLAGINSSEMGIIIPL